MSCGCQAANNCKEHKIQVFN